MKKSLVILATIAIFCATNIFAQSSGNSYYGNALNLGVGAAYYKNIGTTVSAINVNLELSVANNFTLAPFITFYTFRNNYYWGNSNTPYRYYDYNEMVFPVGLKGAYYLDELLTANSKWDFYIAGSIGYILRTTSWEKGYGGTNLIDRGTGPLFIDAHLGAEYHINNKAGLFVDFSSGISTIGLAMHLNK